MEAKKLMNLPSWVMGVEMGVSKGVSKGGRLYVSHQLYRSSYAVSFM